MFKSDCLGVSKDLANHVTDMVLLYSEASGPEMINNYFWKSAATFPREITPRNKWIHPKISISKYIIFLFQINNGDSHPTPLPTFLQVLLEASINVAACKYISPTIFFLSNHEQTIYTT